MGMITATQSLSKSYLPPEPRCHLYLETEWISRWRVEYPTEFPPASHPAAFAPDDFEQKKAGTFFYMDD